LKSLSGWFLSSLLFRAISINIGAKWDKVAGGANLQVAGLMAAVEPGKY